MDEFLRILDSLQIADEYNVATPANWKPGEPVVVPPPQTQEAAEERMRQGYDCMDWYLCRKPIETKRDAGGKARAGKPK
jgi:peroxiredoxin (alkyl hydroperoxide reductase subunit C)